MPQLDVIMYHFVRPVAGSAWPHLKGLEVAAFEAQLDYLQATYDILPPDDAIAILRGEDTLTAPACLLTFDDGYKDHVTHVFPRLEARGLKTAFFPPACAALDRVVLAVNKIHFILASGADPAEIGAHIDAHIADPQPYRRRHHHAFGYDTADVIYVKRMLQHALPDALRQALTDALFAKVVSADPADFADTLYCNADDLRLMHESGHLIGSHGDAHVWLNALPIDAQRADITRALRLRDAIGAPRHGFAFCYPYGGYNADTLACLHALGCTAAFTTRMASTKPGIDAALEIPRLDTNMFPPRAAAPAARNTRASCARAS